MRRRTTILIATALLLTGAAAPAAAQARGYIGFGAGVSIPAGTFADSFKLGWLGQVVAGITGPSGVLGGRIDGTYGQNSVKGTGSGHLSLFGANADLVWTPGKRPAKAHPYLLGGVGFYNSKPSGVGTSQTKFAWNAGAGLQVHTGNRMDFFAEARYISVQATGGNLNFIPITVGLRFGGI